MKILVIDDDPQFTRSFFTHLQKTYTIHLAHDSITAAHKIEQHRYDVVILDINLPGNTAKSLCQRVAQKLNTPVMIVTKDARIESKVSLLQAGAKDYICKPVHVDELRARIAAHIKRPSQYIARGPLSTEDLVLDTTTHMAFLSGRPLYLRSKEFKLLECLLMNKNKTVDKELLCAYVWDDDRSDTNNLHVHMSNLRRKLAPSQVIIATMHRVGYRLIRKPNASPSGTI